MKTEKYLLTDQKYSIKKLMNKEKNRRKHKLDDKKYIQMHLTN